MGMFGTVMNGLGFGGGQNSQNGPAALSARDNILENVFGARPRGQQNAPAAAPPALARDASAPQIGDIDHSISTGQADASNAPLSYFGAPSTPAPTPAAPQNNPQNSGLIGNVLRAIAQIGVKR